MDENYPEIALKHPKADPRTVLLHKRNFMESSSDHIQEIYRNSTYNSTAKCDKSINLCKYSTAPLPKSTTTDKIILTKKSIKSLSETSLSSTSSSPLKLLTASLLSSWFIIVYLLYSTLVNFLKSCHFKANFINNNLYKIQTTKFIFFLLFIWCAIFLQTAQAVSMRRISTSGRKLILHTNVYRENYHQKLSEDQRRHNHQQQLIQLQLQEHHQQQQPQQQHQKFQILSLPITNHPQQTQINHLLSPSQKFVRHLQTPQHRHHLHQRAAPITSPHYHLQEKTMSYCNGNKIYQNLYQQMNASMLYIKQLCANYLRDRGNETFEDMSETWKLISLETRNPNRKQVSIENELHKKIHNFYLNLHTFDQLIDYASQDTNDNKTKIEHGEEISIDKIIKFLQSVKAEIKFNMKEAENLLEILEIEKPDLADNSVVFNSNIGRRVRDFLIIKNLIEEFENVLHLVQNYCESKEPE